MLTMEMSIGPSLTEDDARRIFAQGEEFVVFALMELVQQLAQRSAAVAASSDAPATPSGSKPPYQKPNGKARCKKPGRKLGHVGSRKGQPERIDDYQEHRAECCPDCGGRLKKCADSRTRYVEDIPAGIEPVVTEHTVHRDWCPACRKNVEARVPDALSGSTFGNRMLALSGWLHYGLGNTLSQIVEVFNFHLQMKVTPGGLSQMWQRLQAVLYPWYEAIQREALKSAVLHADETGWRVNGKTRWLWCFSTSNLTFYMIDRSRGSPALLKFFTEEFHGVLVTDFWGAYNAVACALRQTCLVHLLRDLEHVEKYKAPSEEWAPFAKKLRRLLADAIRLWRAKAETPADAYASRRERIARRLDELIDEPWKDSQAKRLVKRLRRHRHDLFTFMDRDGVPFENNHAERAIRPAVIIRKNSYGNRSERGADVQAVLMTVFRTLKQRGHDPLAAVVSALRTYNQTNQLPPLPQQTASDG
jgi:transposase